MPSDNDPPGFIPADEMADFMRLYLEETGEQLDQLVQTLLKLETEPADSRLLNESFRLIHSIKGSAALMGFDRITTLAHHLETHFEHLRSGVRRFDDATADVVLKCIDHLRECNGRLERGEPPPTAGDLLDVVKGLETRPAAAAVKTPPASGPPQPDPVPVRAAASSPAADPGVGVRGPPAGGRRHRVSVAFQAGLPMAELRAELVLTRLSAVGTIVASAPPRDQLAAVDDLRSLVVELDTDATAAAIRGAAGADGVERIDVEDAPRAEPPPPRREAEAGTVDQGAAAAATLRVDVARLDGLLNLAGELLLQRARFTRIVADLAPTFRKSALPGRIAGLAESLREIIGRLRAGEPAADVLADLEEGLRQLEEQMQAVQTGRRHFGQLVESTDRLTRVADALQRGVLLTRMVPIGPLFNRFKRSVRDIAAELGKKVRLEIAGEKTELDKRMIDELGDPLVHLIRNAIDHGIEPGDVRVGRGKPEVATVSLEAAHRGNNVVITIRDDGGGIDTRRIRQRVIDRGLLTAEQAAALDDRGLVDFIWQPGFSTASRVSGISGRGVGMDIVRTRIAALSGAIEVQSAEGVGTAFVIRLPLTLAIAHCLLFRVPHGVFAAPLDDVREIVELGPGRVVDVRGHRSCEIRGEYLPLVSIDEVFSWAAAPAARRSADFAVVLQSGPRAVALEVAELVGREELVVKSLADNFTHLRGLGGAGILGDGSVCLLLDVATAIALAGGRPAAADTPVTVP
jgi:two-component system chemotaxis sensor kinase CheA